MMPDQSIPLISSLWTIRIQDCEGTYTRVALEAFSPFSAAQVDSSVFLIKHSLLLQVPQALLALQLAPLVHKNLISRRLK